MKINIMTWNTAITENLDVYTSKPDDFMMVIDYVKKFLTKANSIVFLQQMVYKESKEWIEHKLYTTFIDNIGEEYDVQFSKKSSFMMTVAIAQKDTMEALNENYYSNKIPENREIAVKFNGITFLGVHAQNGSNNEQHLKALSGKADIILGDFNAGNYKESENRFTFNSILKEHICICNMPTKVIYKGDKVLRKSCIDHIFVREEMVTKCSNLVVHEDITYSDHYPITFEIMID